VLDAVVDWLEQYMTSWSVRQLALRLRFSLPESDSPKRAFRNALAQRAHESEQGRLDVLDAIDFVCRTDPDLGIPTGWTGTAPVPGTEPLAYLDHILATGGSAYHYRNGRLERRVDDTAGPPISSAGGRASGRAGVALSQGPPRPPMRPPPP